MMEHKRMDDAVLIARAQDGDDQAFTQLLSRYKPLVRARASTMFIAGSDQEDVVQEGMIGLFKAVRDYQPARGASFRTFAARCVTAQILDAVRAATREKHRPLNDSLSLQGFADPDGEETWAWFAPLAADADNPETRLLSAETAADVRRFMATELTPLEQAALRLLMAHLSYREAAAYLGRNVKSIDNAVRRARNKFARRFRPAEHDNQNPHGD